jgi:hypothetical protein
LKFIIHSRIRIIHWLISKCFRHINIYVFYGIYVCHWMEQVYTQISVMVLILLLLLFYLLVDEPQKITIVDGRESERWCNIYSSIVLTEIFVVVVVIDGNVCLCLIYGSWGFLLHTEWMRKSVKEKVFFYCLKYLKYSIMHMNVSLLVYEMSTRWQNDN